jgi:hypothetical protein
MNTIKTTPAPKYNYFVQIKDHQDLREHTLKFLESHATRPLHEISVEEINQFLADCWGRARWSGEGLSQDCEVGS